MRSETVEADIFRVATLTWSVPCVSRIWSAHAVFGLGRRARPFAQRVIALGDPVFNLSVRDNLIGWSTGDRASRLVNLLDAYVLGAVATIQLASCREGSCVPGKVT